MYISAFVCHWCGYCCVLGRPQIIRNLPQTHTKRQPNTALPITEARKRRSVGRFIRDLPEMTRFLKRFEALEFVRERLKFAKRTRKLRERTRKIRERTQKILERTRKNPRKNAKERAKHVNICAKHVEICAKPAKYRKGRQNPQNYTKLHEKEGFQNMAAKPPETKKITKTSVQQTARNQKNRQAKGRQNATGEQKNEAGSMQSSQFKVGCSPPFELSDASARTLEIFERRNSLKKAKAKS